MWEQQEEHGIYQTLAACEFMLILPWNIRRSKIVQYHDSVLDNCFLAGSFVPVEGIVYYVNSIDGCDNALYEEVDNAAAISDAEWQYLNNDCSYR